MAPYFCFHPTIHDLLWHKEPMMCAGLVHPKYQPGLIRGNIVKIILLVISRGSDQLVLLIHWYAIIDVIFNMIETWNVISFLVSLLKSARCQLWSNRRPVWQSYDSRTVSHKTNVYLYTNNVSVGCYIRYLKIVFCFHIWDRLDTKNKCISAIT